MKNPFRFFRSNGKQNTPQPAPEEPAAAPSPIEEPVEEQTPAPPKDEPKDDFIEWLRSRTRGGIERRERNDIYEAYTVYGIDGEGQLTARLYHRYPEHEREFGLSYSRTLSFEEFNTRLLSELDKGGLTLAEYNDCIRRAEALSGLSEGTTAYEGFEEGEPDALHDFCEGLENIKEKSYRHSEGIYRCDGESIIGGERLNIWFRRPIAHDALDGTPAGVSMTPISSYDIEDIWIMGVCNRLRESGAKCEYFLLRSEWSLNSESIYLIAAEGLPAIDGRVLIAVAESGNFYRFGFYSLNFSNK